MKTFLSNLIRKRIWGRFALDNLPSKVQFPDGVERTIPRDVARTMRVWSSLPELRQESDSVLSAYKGGDIIDIGAYFGYYSLLLAHKMRSGDRAISLEPDINASPDLLRSLSVAAANYPSREFFMLPLPVGDGHSISVSFPGGESGHPCFSAAKEDSMNSFLTVTVDSLVETLHLKPKFIKIDVEGAESFVLDGLNETLATHKPTLMLEVHPLWQPEGRSVEELAERLVKHGYQRSFLNRQDDVAIRELWTPS